jgi:hypothetical protein
LRGTKGETLVESAEVKPELLVSTMGAVFVLGLVAITALMGVLKVILDLSVGQIVPFAVLSFLIMLLVEGACLWLLIHRKRITDEAGDKEQLKGQATKELDAAQARVLPEPIPSVTEHTTRAFEPLYNERTSK